MSIGFFKNSGLEHDGVLPIVRDGFSHAICIGETGSGKTTGFILPNIEDRIQRGYGLLIYDFKGTLSKNVKFLADKHARLIDIHEIGTAWGECINIIKWQNSKELYELFFSIINKNDISNSSWHSSAAILAVGMVEILRSIEELDLWFSQNGLSIGQLEFFYALDHDDKVASVSWGMDGSKDGLHRFVYPKTASIKSLNECVGTISNFAMFMDGGLALCACIKAMLSRAMNDKFALSSKRFSEFKQIKSDASAIFAKPLKALERLTKNFEKLSSYRELSVAKTDDYAGNYGVIFSLNSSIYKLCDFEFFSQDKFDALQALNSGKIIIVQTGLLSDDLANALNKSLCMSLAKRAKLKDKNPVSIVIDEAYRVINKNSDLATDILREARAEIILAIQNESQLINKLGEARYKELKGNLTEQFIFRCNDKNHSLETDVDVSKLTTHEFVRQDSKQVSQSAKIFIDEQEANRSELKYQLQNGVLEKLLSPEIYSKLCEDNNEYLALFDETLFERDNSVLIQEYSSGSVSIYEVYDKVLEEKIASEIEKIAIEQMIFGTSIGGEDKKPFRHFFKR